MKNANVISISIKLIIVGIILFSLIYPLLVGGIGQIWGDSARGSIIEYKGKPVGSKLIGQDFSSNKYFHSRPSSINYDARLSSSANLGPNNIILQERVENNIKEIIRLENIEDNKIPADFVTESGSALDPHISPQSAYIQVSRIAKTTGISEEKLKDMINEQTKSKLFGIIGMKRVNVLELNLIIEEVLN